MGVIGWVQACGMQVRYVWLPGHLVRLACGMQKWSSRLACWKRRWVPFPRMQPAQASLAQIFSVPLASSSAASPHRLPHPLFLHTQLRCRRRRRYPRARGHLIRLPPPDRELVSLLEPCQAALSDSSASSCCLLAPPKIAAGVDS